MYFLKTELSHVTIKFSMQVRKASGQASFDQIDYARFCYYSFCGYPEQYITFT